MEVITLPTFGEKLKALRMQRELSQDGLAQILSTSKQVISRYENNQTTPKIDVVFGYAKKLRVPLDFLIDNQINTIEEACSKVSSVTALSPKTFDFSPKETALIADYRTLSEDGRAYIDQTMRLAKQSFGEVVALRAVSRSGKDVEVKLTKSQIDAATKELQRLQDDENTDQIDL